jgi:hypothetical protein
MALAHEHVGSKILAKINIYILTRAELLCTLCYEIPCGTWDIQLCQKGDQTTQNI